MPSLGMAEIIVIVIAALVLLGPDKLPKAARSVGKALNELRRHSDRVKDEFRDVVDFDEITSVHRDITSIRDDVRSTLTSTGASLVGSTDDGADVPSKGQGAPGLPGPAHIATGPAATAPQVVDLSDVLGDDASTTTGRALPGTDDTGVGARDSAPDTSPSSAPTPAPSGTLLDAAALTQDTPSRRIPGVGGSADDAARVDGGTR